MQLFITNFASLDLVNYTHQILQSLAYTVNVTIYRDDNDFIFTRTPKKVFFFVFTQSLFTNETSKENTTIAASKNTFPI